MEFSAAKELITFMENHPYIIWHKLKLFAHADWLKVMKKLIRALEIAIEESDSNTPELLDEDELSILIFGGMVLPAVMLKEQDSRSMEVYTALVMLIQNYGQIFENAELINLADNLSILLHGANTFKTLILQAESVCVMNQSILSNTRTPYNLSGNFLRAIMPKEEKEND